MSFPVPYFSTKWSSRRKKELSACYHTCFFVSKPCTKTLLRRSHVNCHVLINRFPSRLLDFGISVEFLTNLFAGLWDTNNLIHSCFQVYCTSSREKLNLGKSSVFLSYSSTSKGIQVYHPSTKKFYVLLMWPLLRLNHSSINLTL